jgi:hypothetical protein
MKKILLKTIIFSLVMFVGIGCSDFDDINVNPNNPVKVSPSTLLSSSLRSLASGLGHDNPLLYIQHFAETQYTEDSRYQTVNYDFNGWYTGALANLQHIIDLNTEDATKADALSGGSNANQIAVARILKVYFYNILTDRWGPIPYTQALQGRELFKPAYDSQETIYNSFFSELEGAISQMDGGPGVNGDFIFGGDMDMWKKFANSLRMIYALRISDVDAGKAQSEFNAAMSGGVIGDGEDVMYPYLAESANQNPWFGAFITRTDFAISETLVNFLKPLNDPRLAVYADPAPDFGDIRGMPYGIEGAGDIPNSQISFPGFPGVRGQDAPIGIVTRSQILFSMAEAAVRGWISDDAGQLYNDAIKASMQQWGVFDETAYNDYIAQPDVAWDGGNGMELIATQKWVALYLQGYEAWAEWRRLDMPALSPAPDALNPSKQIPVRQGYPTSERDLNGPNYEAGVSMLGGADDLATKLWWDK